jgi:hypothetical protein
MAFGRSADKIIAPNERTTMKLLIMTATVMALLGASCAHPLERVADEHHQARIEAAYAHQPLGRGAADGLGTYYARSREESSQVQHAVVNP